MMGNIEEYNEKEQTLCWLKPGVAYTMLVEAFKGPPGTRQRFFGRSRCFSKEIQRDKGCLGRLSITIRQRRTWRYIAADLRVSSSANGLENMIDDPDG